MQSFCRWAVVPEWCRCLFFYDAAVFLYSGIERNDTRNFREKKIFRVALSGTLEVNEGGNLAASKIRNLECPSYEICLIDYGCGKFNRKIHIMEQYP